MKLNSIWKAAALAAACLMMLSACAGEPASSSSSSSGETSSQSEISSQSEVSSETSSQSETSSESQSTGGSVVDASFFDDAVFIGDSVSLRLNYYCQSHSGVLGKAQFLTSGSMGSGNALEKISESSVHPVYQGEKMLIEDGVKASGAKKVFIMLGMNDIALYGIEDSVKNMDTLIQRILKKSPDVEIYVQSMTPMMKDAQLKDLNNANLDKYNQQLKELCTKKGYHFVDVASAMKDSEGNLIPEYCSDPEGMGMHFTDAGAEAWIDYLMNNVQ